MWVRPARWPPARRRCARYGGGTARTAERSKRARRFGSHCVIELLGGSSAGEASADGPSASGASAGGPSADGASAGGASVVAGRPETRAGRVALGGGGSGESPESWRTGCRLCVCVGGWVCTRNRPCVCVYAVRSADLLKKVAD